MKQAIVFALAMFVTSQAVAQSRVVKRANVDVLVEPHHSSTVAEGQGRGYGAAARGEAALIEAVGGALIDRESAREQFITNHRSAVKAYYERKATYAQWHRQKHANAVSTLAQQEWERRQLPARMSPAELSADGHIAWPELLAAKDYQQSRETLARLFRERATGASSGRVNSVRKAISDETVRLQANLKSKIDRYTPADYLAARKFIERLRYAATAAGTLVLVADR